ncbi:MAG TPA: acyltransferase [Noviherbaspirillum sp.]
MPIPHLRFLDLFKAVAANLIVLHHLAFYGPMSDHVRPVLPGVIEWLDQHARIAVQVFLAVGGFLAAKSLSNGQAGPSHPLRAILRRYAKLAPPFIAAMAGAVAANAVASLWMTHESISAPPTLAQFAAHALLLHGLLGVESLSAGAWYVAIDFQLYALLTVLLCTAARGGRFRWLAPLLVTTAAAASLYYFNRDASWDNWALYFIGSYGLGALAWYASDRHRHMTGAALIVAVITLLGVTSLALDFRIRIAVALATSLALVALSRGALRLPGQDLGLTSWLGRISYGIFLMHFPVSLVVNALFTRFTPAETAWQASGMLVAWMASIAAGDAFHRWVEVPLGALLRASPAREDAVRSRPFA